MKCEGGVRERNI